MCLIFGFAVIDNAQILEVIKNLQTTQIQIQETQANLAQLQVGSSDTSPPERGDQLLRDCQLKERGISQFTDEKQFISDAELEELNSRFRSFHNPNEDIYTALLTPFFERLITDCPDYVFANSERIPWIHTVSNVRKNYQMPDGFICDKLAFVKHSPTLLSNREADGIRENSFLFGECAWALRDALLCLVEIRLKFSINHAIGGIFSKVQNILRHSKYLVTAKVCLIWKKHMYLLNFTANGLISMHSFDINAPGSSEIIKKFIFSRMPSWVRATRILCQKLGVHLVEDEDSAFLGSGAHG